MTRIWTAVLATCIATGCTVETDEHEIGGGKGDGNGTCTVPQYGDGTCQIDLACDIPDIDCFVMFEDDAKAAEWAKTQWSDVVSLPQTDPRFVRGRQLADRAWDIFRSRVQLGMLAERHLGVVVVDGAANAFIMGDADGVRGGLSIQIYTGLLDSTKFTDDQIVGVLLHELTHLVELHFLDEIIDRIRKFYVALPGDEPIGAQQTENAGAKLHGAAWRELAQLVGPYSTTALSDLPYGGDLQEVFWLVTDAATAWNSGNCASQISTLKQLYRSLTPLISPIDDAIAVTPDIAQRIVTALAAVTTCLGSFQTLNQVADAAGWGTYLQSKLSADEQTLLATSAFDAIRTLVRTRREKMRALEAQFVTETKLPWTSVRFFSYEERADDASVRIQTSVEIDATHTAREYLGYFEDNGAACEQLVISAQPIPYGVNLLDEHHGTCWRYAHQLQLATSSSSTSTSSARIVTEAVVPHEPKLGVRRPGPRIIY